MFITYLQIDDEISNLLLGETKSEISFCWWKENWVAFFLKQDFGKREKNEEKRWQLCRTNLNEIRAAASPFVLCTV